MLAPTHSVSRTLYPTSFETASTLLEVFLRSIALATAAIELLDIPRALQYSEFSQVLSGFFPLLALQLTQHKAMLSTLTRERSLTICSQEGQVALTV
jgi:hypothetical protein